MDGPLVQRTPSSTKGQRRVMRFSPNVGSRREIDPSPTTGSAERRIRPMAASDVVTLRVARAAHVAMLAHALDGLPHEACGLLVGPAGGDDVVRFVPCENAAKSAKVYTITE